MAHTPPQLTEEQLNNVQGDIWKKGFPKFFETYYFFSISEESSSNGKLFSQCLRDLATRSPPLISTLQSVYDGRLKMPEAESKREEDRFPVSNALIAFTREGLQAIQKGFVNDNSLELDLVKKTDRAFFAGMASDRELNDPDKETWDPLFQTNIKIHGLLKIAGSSEEEVNKKLKAILKILKHDTVTIPVPGNSPPTLVNSRIDGWTRPNHRGKEHFGFEDSISQPLMSPIDELDTTVSFANMNTDPSILIVSDTTASGATDSTKRPPWMKHGSFLVFRKLEQDVRGFEKLTAKYVDHGCSNEAHMGAKLMGRWESGAPIEQFPTKDTTTGGTGKNINNFVYRNSGACPLSAHTRKSNGRIDPNIARNTDPRTPRVRIIRNGIPYGSDYKGHENDGSKRGLLFVCYQGHIEDGFQHIQAAWSNNSGFPEPGTGHDPIIGQVDQVDQVDQKGKKVNGQLITTIVPTKPDSLTFQQLVTLKGGDYFFVPSIKALRNDLGQA